MLAPNPAQSAKCMLTITENLNTLKIAFCSKIEYCPCPLRNGLFNIQQALAQLVHGGRGGHLVKAVAGVGACQHWRLYLVGQAAHAAKSNVVKVFCRVLGIKLLLFKINFCAEIWVSFKKYPTTERPHDVAWQTCVCGGGFYL